MKVPTGLVVRKPLDRPTWTIFHGASSLPIITGCLTQTEAVEVAASLAEVNWNRPADEIRVDDDARDLAHRVQFRVVDGPRRKK